MKYDDASWHYGGDFPAGLPNSAGAIHIANFVAWAALNGLGGEDLEQVEQLRARTTTPTEWFIRNCDEKFTDEDLSSEGNLFAAEYYGSGSAGEYLADYERAFPDIDDLYRAPAGWESYDVAAPVITRRWKRWRSSTGRAKRPFWMFW